MHFLAFWKKLCDYWNFNGFSCGLSKIQAPKWCKPLQLHEQIVFPNRQFFDVFAKNNPELRSYSSFIETDSVNLLHYEYRKLIVKNEILLYWVDEKSEIATIARVIYYRCDDSDFIK